MDNFWEKSKLVDEPQQQPTAQPPAPSVGEFWKQSPAVKRGTDPKKLEEEHKKALAALDEQYQAKDFVRDALPGQVVLNQVAIDLASPVQRIVGNSERADELNRAGNLVEQALQEQEKGGIVPDILQRGSRGALRSLGSMTAGGAAGRAMGVGAAVGAIGTAAAQQANQAYTEGKDAGLKGGRLAEYVLGNAIIEAAPALVMQGMGMGGAEATVGRMLGDGARKEATKQTLKQFGKSTAKGILQELPEELVTTAGQETTSQAYGVNPEALLPAKFGNALIETAVQTVLTLGFAETMNAAKQKVADWMMRGVKPEQIVETLQQMAPTEQQQAPEQPKPPIDVAQSEQQRVGALQERFRNRALDTKEQDIWNDPRYPLMLSLGEPEVAQKLAEKPTYLPADFEEAGLPPVNNPQLRRQWKERVKEAVSIPPEARRAMLEDTSNEMRITKDWTKVPEGVEPPQSPMIETIQSSFGTVIRLKPRQSTPSGDTVSPQAPPPVTPTTQPEPTSYGQEETKGREGRQGLLTQPVPTAPTAEPSLEQPKPTEQQVRPSAEASSYDDTFNPYTEEHPEYQGWYTVPDGVTKQVLSTQYGDVQVDFYNPQTNQAEVTDEKGDSWVMDMGEEGDGQAAATDTQSQPEQPTPEQPQEGLQNAPESTQTAQATSDTTSAPTQPESQPEAPVAKKRLGMKKQPPAAAPTPPAPPMSGADEIKAAMDGMGKGILDGMYKRLWDRVQAGKTTEQSGAPESALLQIAKILKDSGNLNTIEDLRAVAQDYGNIDRDKVKGKDWQAALRAIISKYQTKPPTATPAEPTPVPEEAPQTPQPQQVEQQPTEQSSLSDSERQELETKAQFYSDNIATMKSSGRKVPERWQVALDEIRSKLAGADPSTELVTESGYYGHPQNPSTKPDDYGLVPIKIDANTDLSWRLERADKLVKEFGAKAGQALQKRKKSTNDDEVIQQFEDAKKTEQYLYKLKAWIDNKKQAGKDGSLPAEQQPTEQAAPVVEPPKKTLGKKTEPKAVWQMTFDEYKESRLKYADENGISREEFLDSYPEESLKRTYLDEVQDPPREADVDLRVYDQLPEPLQKRWQKFNYGLDKKLIERSNQEMEQADAKYAPAREYLKRKLAEYEKEAKDKQYRANVKKERVSPGLTEAQFKDQVNLDGLLKKLDAPYATEADRDAVLAALNRRSDFTGKKTLGKKTPREALADQMKEQAAGGESEVPKKRLGKKQAEAKPQTRAKFNVERDGEDFKGVLELSDGRKLVSPWKTEAKYSHRNDTEKKFMLAKSLVAQEVLRFPPATSTEDVQKNASRRMEIEDSAAEAISGKPVTELAEFEDMSGETRSYRIKPVLGSEALMYQPGFEKNGKFSEATAPTENYDDAVDELAKHLEDMEYRNKYGMRVSDKGLKSKIDKKSAEREAAKSKEAEAKRKQEDAEQAERSEKMAAKAKVDAVPNAQFKKGKYQIAMGDGKQQKEGWVSNNFGIDDNKTITHLKTGLRLPIGPKNMTDAKRIVTLLEAGADWSDPASKFAANHKSIIFATDVARAYRSEDYRDVAKALPDQPAPATKKRLGKKQPPSDQQPPDRKASSGGTKKLGKAPQGPLPQPTKSTPINRNPPSEMTDAIKKDIQSKKNQVGKRSIAEYLNKAFHAAMIVTKSQTTRRNPALFRNFGATIFTRNGSWSINIHEAAHALSAMLSDKVPQWYAQNEMALAQFAASAEAPHASDDSGEEGLAEVIRLYVSNRPVDQALIDSLRQMVEAVAPEAWNALEDAREAYRLHTGRSYLDQEQADRNDIAAAKGKSLIEKSMDAFWTNMNTIVGNSTLIHRYKRHEYAKIAGESAIAMVEPTGFLGWAKGKADREHKIRQHLAEQIQDELKKSPADIDTAYRSKLRSAAVVKQALEGDGLTVYVQGSGLADLSQAEYDALDAAGFPMPKSFAKNFEMQRLTEKSYEQIMKPLKDEKERNDFQTALYDRVAHERHVKYGMPYKGMTDGLKADELKARSDKAFAENPHWEQVSDELQDYMAQTLLLGLIAGHLTVDDVVRIYQKYEDYAPLQRQMEGGKKRLGKILEQTTPNFGLYGAKGSELEYLSLDEAVYNRVNGMVRAYHENMLLKSLRDRVQEISKRKDIPYEARKDIERTLIPLRVDLKMAANIDSGEQRQIFANAINRQMLADMGTDPTGMSDKQVREAAETAGVYVKPESISVDLPGRPVMRATTPNMNQVVGLWEGGNTKFYLIQDPLAYQMVQNLGAKVPEFVQWYSKIVGDFVNPWKRAITQSLRFLYRNILRDPITAAWFAENKTEAIPFYYTAQTVLGKALGTDLYREATQATKTMTLMLDATTTNEHQSRLAKFKEAMWDGLYVDDWNERGPIGKAFGLLSIANAGLLKPVDFINYVTGMRYLSEQSESITRKGRYISARKRGLLPAQAHSEFDQASGEFAQRQANASLSAMVRVAGFMNPALQIIWQTAAAATPASPNQRFKLNTTKVAYLTLLGAGWAASNLLSMRYSMDDDEWEDAKEKLRQRSEEDRMSNLAVHGWLKVPYDNGLAGAVVAFAANQTEDLLLGNDTDFEARSLEVLRKVTSAPGIDNIIPPQPKSIIEATALNYSFFTKKPVVPPELLKLYPNQEFMQSYSDTPEFYVEIAKGLEGTGLDMSPLQIKHMVGGVGTAVWDNAITWIDKLNKGTATYKDFPLIKGMFVNNPDGFQSRSVRELMDMDRRYDEVDAYLRQARDLTPEQRQEAEQVRERLQLAHATMKRVSEVYRKVEKERDKPEPDQKKIDDLEGQMARIASEFINDKKIDLEALSEPYQSAKAKLIPYKADNSSTWKMGKGEPEKPRRPLKTKAADPKAWEKYEKEVESYPDRMKQWEEEQKEAVEFVRQYEDVFKQQSGGKLPDKSKEAMKAIRDLATGAGAPAEPKRRLGETASEWNRRRESHTENRKRFIEARQEALRLLKSSE